jgi:hypothetical protein
MPKKCDRLARRANQFAMRKLQVKSFLVIPGSSPMAMPRNDGVDERLWALPMSRPDSGNVPHVAQPIEYSHNGADNTNK